jgi:hypothetical protein
MKVFLTRIVLFIGVLVLGLVLLNSILPVYWGNLEFATKASVLRNSTVKYNTFFVGSSRTYRQVIPTVIDDTLSTLSYNLGSYATYGAECFKLSKDYILKELKPSLLVIELQDIQEIADLNLNTSRSNYYIDYNTYILAKEYFRNVTSLSINEQNENIEKYKQSFLKSSFYYGTLMEVFRYVISPKLESRIINNSIEGFYSLDKQILTENNANNIVKRRKEFLEDTTSMLIRKRMIDSVYSVNENEGNAVYVRLVEKLIKVAQKQNTKLVFVLYPKMNPKDYVRLLPIARNIPKPNFIDLANPKVYPELYETENSFDEGHLNEKGAEVLTKLLAHKLKNLNQ